MDMGPFEGRWCTQIWVCLFKGYTPYEGLNLDNQISRKLGVFDRKLEGNHFIFHCYSDIY